MCKEFWWGNYLENVYMKDREKDRKLVVGGIRLEQCSVERFRELFETMEIRGTPDYRDFGAVIER